MPPEKWQSSEMYPRDEQGRHPKEYDTSLREAYDRGEKIYITPDKRAVRYSKAVNRYFKEPLPDNNAIDSPFARFSDEQLKASYYREGNIDIPYEHRFPIVLEWSTGNKQLLPYYPGVSKEHALELARRAHRTLKVSHYDGTVSPRTAAPGFLEPGYIPNAPGYTYSNKGSWSEWPPSFMDTKGSSLRPERAASLLPEWEPPPRPVNPSNPLFMTENVNTSTLGAGTILTSAGAYSSYLDALQHGATHEQAIEAAKNNAMLGAGFTTFAAVAPRLALPLASGLGGMDAVNDAFHAVTGGKETPYGALAAGGALGLAALLDPMTAPLPIGYGGYKLLKPLARAAFAHDYPTGVSETRQIKNRSAATQSTLAPVATPMSNPVKEIKPLYESSGAKSTAKSVASGITEKRKSALSDKDQADIQKYLQSRPQSRPLRQNDAKKVFGGGKASGGR